LPSELKGDQKLASLETLERVRQKKEYASGRGGNCSKLLTCDGAALYRNFLGINVAQMNCGKNLF
jgi:hypothetical protein